MSDLDDLIARAAKEHGYDPAALRRYIQVESSGNPHAEKGSHSGYFMLTRPEFENYGGKDPDNPDDHFWAGVKKLNADRDWYKSTYGEDPTAGNLYVIHNQGRGGAAAHYDNPDQPAWKSMYSTAEGRRQGEQWAREAVWGNIPDDMKGRFGNDVDNVTSRDFTDLWHAKIGQPSFDTLMGQYVSHVAGMRDRYNIPAAETPSPQGQPQPADQRPDPQQAALFAMLRNSAQSQQLPAAGTAGAPPYANAGVQSFSPATMNYLQMILARNNFQGNTG